MDYYTLVELRHWQRGEDKRCQYMEQEIMSLTKLIQRFDELCRLIARKNYDEPVGLIAVEMAREALQGPNKSSH